MSQSEKLQLLEDVWESLDPDTLPSPDWHREILEERMRMVASGAATYMSLEEAEASVLKEIS